MALRAKPYAKAAFRIGRGVYRGWKSRKRAANASKKRRVRARIGERIGTGNAKVAGRANTNDGSLDTRVLYSQQLLSLTQGTDVGERERDVVNFRGISICFTIKQEQQNISSFLNYAVIAPKDLNGNTLNIPVSQFFRSTGSATTRSIDFDTSLRGIDFHCLPINTDQYNIYLHRRVQLHGNSDTYTQGFRNFRHYIPLKRQVRYQAGLTFPAGKNMYFVFWLDNMLAAASSASVTGVATMQTQIKRYFQEPAKC